MSKPYQILLLGAALALAAAFMLGAAGHEARAAFASSVALLTGTPAAVALLDDRRNAKLSPREAATIDALARTGRTSAAVRQVRETTGADTKRAYRYVRRAAKMSS